MASKSPLFSVIVPVFNAGEYLDRAIASVRAQTWTDFELILVDDGSTDDAVDRAGSIRDSRLRVMRQPNQGAPVALNRGLAAASGEYVAFLDADDFWAPNKLERHLECFLAHPKADLTFTGIVYVGADDEPLNLPQRQPTGSFTFEQLLVDYVIGTSSAIAVRKTAMQIAGSFDPTMLYMYDVDLVLRIARARPANVVGIAEPLTFYRRRPGQQTSDWRPMAHYWAKLLAQAPLTRRRRRSPIGVPGQSEHAPLLLVSVLRAGRSFECVLSARHGVRHGSASVRDRRSQLEARIGLQCGDDPSQAHSPVARKTLSTGGNRVDTGCSRRLGRMSRSFRAKLEARPTVGVVLQSASPLVAHLDERRRLRLARHRPTPLAALADGQRSECRRQ